jgi:hypothetical protein
MLIHCQADNRLDYLVQAFQSKDTLGPEEVFSILGIRGKILHVKAIQTSPIITDATKSALLFKKEIESAIHCPICKGVLDTRKSVSYDHITPERDKGTGDIENVDLVHPYCNTGYKESRTGESQESEEGLGE